MTDTLFRRLFDGPLFVLETDEAPPGWVAFIWTAGGAAPETVGIAASGGNGDYVFAPAAPPVVDAAAAIAFAGAVSAWVKQFFGQANACVWLADSRGPVFAPAASSALAFVGSGMGGTFVTSADFNCPIGQLTLSVPQGVIFTIGARGWRLRTVSGSRVTFTASGGGAPTVSGDSALPFLGPVAGTIAMSGTLSRHPDLGTLAAFETGFHLRHGSVDGGPDARQVHPLLCSGANLPDLAYDGVVDPRDLLNNVEPLSDPAAGRYRTMFMPRGRAASWYVDALGHPLDLVVLGGVDADGVPAPFSGALVPQPRGPSADSLKAIYLAPAGDFALAPAGDDTGVALPLLPGLFGSERIGLTGYAAAGSHDRLRFQPNQPAFAPVFPLPTASLAAPDAGTGKPRLDGRYVTSWAAVLDGPGGATTYDAQPDGASLYAPQAGAAVMPPLAAPMRLPQPAQALLLPILPYAGLADPMFAADLIGGFESQILSAERKRLVGAHTVPRLAAARRAGAATAASVEAATPQGLLAAIATGTGGDPSYEKVVLARCATAAGTLDFGFRTLGAELQSLFQTNQLMAVIVDPKALGTVDPSSGQPAFDREIEIAGWRMTAAVGETGPTGAKGNILILKFCDGPLVDLVTNPSKWVEAGTFSVTGQGDDAVALTALSQELKTYIDDGIAAYEVRHDDLFANFARIVRDPSWQGALVLRARMAASGLPAQIEGLAAGIDFTRFEAHHFGVTASRVVVDGTAVSIATPSSLFALVDYVLPSYRQNVADGGSPDMPVPLPGDGDFAFAVLQLQVLFENAAIKDFRSRIQLTSSRWFGSRVTAAHAAIGTLPVSALVLRGSYQRQGETALYVFEQNAATVMALASDVLPAVALDRVVFNTLSDGADGTVRSRFLVWGTFEFAVLGTRSEGAFRPVDLLSFGLAAGQPLTTSPTGLKFSGLDIAMSSPAGTPNAVTFAFETGKLALDAGASVPRLGSLHADLALEVESFIAGPADMRPIDFGYLPVGVETRTKAIAGPWWGVVYKINMGSPGALVGKAGFASRLLVAWAPTTLPGDAAAALFVGLQLPGAAPGAKLLSLQGVLKLSIDAITLRREVVTATREAFVLRLSDIGLTFLSIVKLPTDPINFFLFGDPSGSGSIGWYAAYVQKADETRLLTEHDRGQREARR